MRYIILEGGGATVTDAVDDPILAGASKSGEEVVFEEREVGGEIRVDCI